MSKHIQTIEKTGKRWKLLQLLGGLLLAFGIVIIIGQGPIEKAPWFIGGGIGLMMLARIGVWWNHS